MAAEKLDPNAPQELRDYMDQRGLPDCLTYEPGPSRDLIWCHILNEPTIVEFRDAEGVREPYCPNCDTFGLDRHTFIAHVLKPTGV